MNDNESLTAVTDEMLLDRIPTHPELLEELYSRWGPRWTGLIVTTGVSRNDVADVVQSVLMEVWNHASRFNARRGSAEAWLLRIARFRAIDHLRRQRPSAMWADEIGIIAEDNETRRWVADAMSHLRTEERSAIQLVYYYGFTHQEVARMWRTPIGTVKSWISRGLAKLRQNMEQEGV